MSITTTGKSEADLIILNFPSISTLIYNYQDFDQEIIQLAHKSNKILILIVTSNNLLTSPESFNHDVNNNSWSNLQTILIHFYSTIQSIFILKNEPLNNINILLQDITNFDFKNNLNFNFNSIHQFHFKNNNQQQQQQQQTTSHHVTSVSTTALGGTFDHLHIGHKILLTLSAWITTNRLIVGISDKVLLKNKKYPELLESLQQRTLAVKSFLQLIKPTLQLDLPPLQDVYGPTSVDPDIEAIVVSDETRSGADAVNAERAKNGLSTLRIDVIHLIPSHPSSSPTSPSHVSTEDIATKMGSTGIREWIHNKLISEKK